MFCTKNFGMGLRTIKFRHSYARFNDEIVELKLHRCDHNFEAKVCTQNNELHNLKQKFV